MNKFMKVVFSIAMLATTAPLTCNAMDFLRKLFASSESVSESEEKEQTTESNKTKDGFIFNSELNQYVNQPLQSTFIKTAYIKDNFVLIKKRKQLDPKLSNNPSQYIVINRPGLNQKTPGPCGFYSIYHLMCLFGETNKDLDLPRKADLSNREKFEKYKTEWVKHIRKYRVSRLLTLLNFPIEQRDKLKPANEGFISGNNDFIEAHSMPEIFKRWCAEMLSKETDFPDFRKFLIRGFKLFALEQLKERVSNTLSIDKSIDEADKAIEKYNKEVKSINLDTSLLEVLAAWKKLETVQTLIATKKSFNPIENLTKPLSSGEAVGELFVKKMLDFENSSAWLDGEEAEWLIKNHIPSLYKKSSIKGVSNEFKEGITVVNPSFAETGMYDEAKKQFSKGFPQFMILHSSGFQNPKSLRFDGEGIWKPATGGHFNIAKIEWTNPKEPKKCTPIITTVDSYPIKDNRFVTITHWLHYFFVS